MKKKKRFLLHLPLFICILLFMVISIFTIYSAMSYLSPSLGNLAMKQFFWYLIGFFLIFIIIKISNPTIYKLAWYIYITNVLLLFVLLIIGQPINGSKCWFILPGIGSFQPSEFMKISLMLILSVVIGNWEQNLKKPPTVKEEIKLLFQVGILFFIPSILTFLEPDTGAVLIYSIIFVSTLWISSFRKRWFIIGSLLIIILLGLFLGLYFYRQDTFVSIFGTNLFYRIDRLLDWKNGCGMQLENSLVAIGSSGLLGHGYKKTPIYFPESGTDFIFAVFASNFGLLGSMLLIGLIFYFDFILIHMLKQTKNLNNQLMIAGIIGMLLYQQFQNIGMTIGILPITGITLPFISYGGSSLLSYLMVVGVLFNIHYQNKKTIN